MAYQRKPSSKRGTSASHSPKRRKPRTAASARTTAGSVFGPRTPEAKKGNGKKPGVSKTSSAAKESLVEGHRLQKVLAAAGFGSRRACEELITDGRVEVDGQVAELGQRVFPQTQKIRVDGESLPKTKPVYLALNKPRGYLSTNADQQGRRRVIDLIPPSFGRVFPIGRLDQESEGLILLTNDGALCERLAHPRYAVAKTYQVQVAGLVEPELITQLKKGIHLAEGVVQADDATIKSRHKLSSILEIVLREGKNREIRRMLARAGHKVMHLRRVAVGPIRLAKLLPGDFRPLTAAEVAKLYAAAEIVSK